MGRFTSVQGFADNNSNNRSITYDQAKGTTDGKDNNGDKGGDNKKLATEKVINPYGSTSGAGSGEFHVYRHARAREMARWNALDFEEQQKKEELDFRATLEGDQKQAETKASKNRKKRQREKEAKQRKKFMRAAGIDVQKPENNNTEGNEEEEEFAYIPVAQQQQHTEQEEKKESSSKTVESSSAGPSSDNYHSIPNDGSFLEMMKRKLEEEKEQNTATNRKQKNNHSDKINKQGSSFRNENVIKDSLKNAKGDDEESDEEGPVLPPTTSEM